MSDQTVTRAEVEAWNATQGADYDMATFQADLAGTGIAAVVVGAFHDGFWAGVALMRVRLCRLSRSASGNAESGGRRLM